jgi:hypothetical protein
VHAAGSSPTSISWARKSSALVAGQRLYGLASNGTLTSLGTLSAAARSASDTTWSLLKGWSRYRVCAYNDTGEACTDSP